CPYCKKHEVPESYSVNRDNTARNALKLIEVELSGEPRPHNLLEGVTDKDFRPLSVESLSALLQQSNALSDDGSIRDEAGLVADSLTPTLSSARLGLSRDIGGRASDDDEASIFSVQTPLGRRLTVAAVLDGHHGAAVSRLASEALPRLFAETARKLPAPRLSASAGDAEDVAGALPALVAALEEELYRAFQAGIFATGGSTLLLAVLEEGRLTLANVGDCRAVLSSRGAPLLLNEAHSPGAPGERARFLAAGVVAAADHIQASDINVTRSLGDFDLGPPIKWRDERGAARGPLLSAP
ncbi:hypothetical protein H632_c2600p0, partial [Helicosporidium sp. ATCC 50920]